MAAEKNPETLSPGQELLQDLEALLEELGVRLTSDKRVDGPGGYCRVHGEPRIIVNSRLSPGERAEVILEELARMDLGDVYIAPVLRERIESYADGAAPAQDSV